MGEFGRGWRRRASGWTSWLRRCCERQRACSEARSRAIAQHRRNTHGFTPSFMT
jgi:hypothetical protein